MNQMENLEIPFRFAAMTGKCIWQKSATFRCMMKIGKLFGAGKLTYPKPLIHGNPLKRFDEA
jgi:hypothetical protein